MSEYPRLSDEDLHAYIDGELETARAAEVAVLIRSDADLARRHAAFTADKLRLQQIYGPLADRPLPQAWVDTIARHKRRRQIYPVRRVAYALAASLALAIAGWSAYQNFGQTRDIALTAAMTAYNDHRAALSPAAEAAHVIAAALNVPVKAPDLSKMGFTLAGFQVYEPVSGQKAVKLEYMDAAGRRFAMYLAKSDGTPRFDMLKQGATRICIWDDEALSTIMMGEMSAGEMMRLASLAYTGLSA